MIRSVSEIGDMADFLKSNPFMTMDDYLWRYSVPLIKIMGMDNSHVNNRSDKSTRYRNYVDVKKNSSGILKNDLGENITFPN